MNTLATKPAAIEPARALNRLAIDIEALDPLSQAVIDHPARRPHNLLPPRPEYGIDAAGLLAVAKATREAKRQEFSMARWCGTKACAIGHFILAHPEDDLCLGRVNLMGICDFTPMLRSDTSLSTFNAIAARFCIAVRDALYLFDLSEYSEYDEDGSLAGVGREEVAERIEQFVQENRD